CCTIRDSKTPALRDLADFLDSQLRSMSVAFAPPKPNEWVSANSNWAARGFWTRGKAQNGSGDSSAEVGGSHCSRNAIRHTTTSTAPAPPNRWPMLDLIELTGTFAACSLAQRLMAAASALSLSGVPVPCALM